MTATVRYVAPLLWQGTPQQVSVRTAAPVGWSTNQPQTNIRAAIPVVWSMQSISAYVRSIQAVQWIITPTPLQFREVSGVQWTQDLSTVTARKFTALQWTQDPTSTTVRSVKAVTWSQLPSSGQLRQTVAYTLQQSSTSGQIRQAVAYTLQLNRKIQTTGGLAGLWPLIQSDAMITVNASNLSVSAPVADSTQLNCNTYVTVAPIGALLNQYSGSTKLYYHRQDLSYAFSSVFTTWKLGTISSNTTILALLSQINSQYGIALDPTDIVDGPVAAGSTKIQLVAAANSYVYKPGSSVYIMNQTALGTAVANTNLPGFSAAGSPGLGNNTVLLLHFDGANGATSTTDAASANTNLGFKATSQISTAQYKFGGSSLFLNSGSGGGLSVPDAAWLRFTSDCTIETWCMVTSTTQNGCLFGKDPTSGGTYAELQYYNGTWRLYLDGNSSFQISATSGVAANTWMHIAVVRRSGVWYLYQNGVLLGQYTGGTLGNNNTNPFIVGNFTGLTAALQGYIDEFRISKIARYTGPFTPPTAPFVLD